MLLRAPETLREARQFAETGLHLVNSLLWK